MVTIKKIFFYAFALFSLTSIIYGMAYDYMNGAEIHYDLFDFIILYYGKNNI